MIVHFVLLLTLDYFLRSKTFHLLSPRWVKDALSNGEHEIPLLRDFVAITQTGRDWSNEQYTKATDLSSEHRGARSTHFYVEVYTDTANV